MAYNTTFITHGSLSGLAADMANKYGISREIAAKIIEEEWPFATFGLSWKEGRELQYQAVKRAVERMKVAAKTEGTN